MLAASRTMDTSLVLILLLDNLPGDIKQMAMNDFMRSLARDLSLEESFFNDTRGYRHSPIAHFTNSKQCDKQHITGVVLNIINKSINTRVVPSFDPDYDHEYFVYKMKNAYVETPMEPTNLNSIIGNSIDEGKYSHSVQAGVDDKDVLSDEDLSECDILKKFNEDLRDKDLIDTFLSAKDMKVDAQEVVFPKKVKDQVAIFESLANVTAQTCCGVSVGPHWVLTAASCVGVLAPLYNNKTKQSEKSHYTVIVHAENPLVDGSLHNVTQILVHPDTKAPKESLLGAIKQLHNAFIKGQGKLHKERTPTLALMRVEPAIEIEEKLEFMEKQIGEGVNLQVYGWVLPKNESENRTMRAISVSAVTLNRMECKNIAGYDHPALCLSRQDNVTVKAVEMLTGAPVLAHYGGRPHLVGIAELENRMPLSAYPLADHLAWIQKVTSVG